MSRTAMYEQQYPKEAQVKWWKRTVNVSRNRQVEVTEDYRLSAWLAPAQLMFVTPVRPSVEQKGRVTLGSHGIDYDSHWLEPSVEDISEKLDPVMRQMWGDHLYRIVLTVKKNNLKAKLKYTIR